MIGLGEAIRARRRERGGVSQESLGDDCDMHRNYVGGIERAERKPSFEAVARLADALEIAPSELLARAERNAERYGASWPACRRAG